MKRLIQGIGKLVGIHHTPDNHVTPIFRWGRYHRVRGPGFFGVIPLIERTLPSVKTSIHVGNFYFTEILSQDNIPFTIQMTVLFTFNPDKALKTAAAQLVQGGDNLLRIIVQDYTNQGVRRLAAKYQAEKLGNAEALSTIERNLTGYLTTTMRVLGLAPLKRDGVLLKEIVAPEKFRHTMLDVRHDEALLEVLRSYPVPELVQLLNQMIFASSLKDRSGQLALLLGASDTGQMLPLLGHAYQQNGYDGL
jgi:hypothetical protein